jgi:hypothetical protein
MVIVCAPAAVPIIAVEQISAVLSAAFIVRSSHGKFSAIATDLIIRQRQIRPITPKVIAILADHAPQNLSGLISFLFIMDN